MKISQGTITLPLKKLCKMTVNSFNKINICLPVVSKAPSHISQLHNRWKYFFLVF